jgi:hypothetical protein
MAKAQAAVINIQSAKTPDRPQASRTAIIKPVNFEMAVIPIRGNAPYVSHAFPQKSKEAMIEKQRQGTQSRKSGGVREAKDFEAAFQASRHISTDGWDGIPCSAFRNASISVCRVVGFKMTMAKLALFVEADGYDKNDDTPLVRITKGTPTMRLDPMRNTRGSTDIRARAFFGRGWEARVTFKWDADLFDASDIVNLMHRVGSQVGVGEGRPDSRMGPGVGWGTFDVVQ